MPPSNPDARVILCADDFAISPGVSRGIEELAALGRISATSAIVTLPRWRSEGVRLAALRRYVAIGLHVNLTVGAPLGAVASLAPSGSFSPLKDLVARCVTGRAPDPADVAREVQRQIARFEDSTGYAPDFIDGHQHVHVLPGIRQGFLLALATRFPDGRPFVRDPSDRVTAILKRRRGASKAMTVALLASGFGSALRRAGFPTNHGFSGFSRFSRAEGYGEELESFFRCAGSGHLIMCHPGYPDPQLARLDPVVARRRDELVALRKAPDLPKRIWHVGDRSGDDGGLAWPAAA